MPKAIRLLLIAAFLCPPTLAQPAPLTEEQRERAAQDLIDRGTFPVDWESRLPPDSLGLNAYYSPELAYHVRILSKQGVVSTLEVPQGTWLNVQANQELNAGPEARSDVSNGSAVYRGNIVLRTRRADEVEEADGSALFAVMSRSPVVMTLLNVVVEIEGVKLEE
jgi:hypothetical protein